MGGGTDYITSRSVLIRGKFLGARAMSSASDILNLSYPRRHVKQLDLSLTTWPKDQSMCGSLVVLCLGEFWELHWGQ